MTKAQSITIEDARTLSKTEIVESVACNVFEATTRSVVSGASETYDANLRVLRQACEERGLQDLYQQGWERGTEGLR